MKDPDPMHPLLNLFLLSILSIVLMVGAVLLFSIVLEPFDLPWWGTGLFMLLFIPGCLLALGFGQKAWAWFRGIRTLVRWTRIQHELWLRDLEIGFDEGEEESNA